jgi:hypothetical protein
LILRRWQSVAILKSSKNRGDQFKVAIAPTLAEHGVPTSPNFDQVARKMAAATPAQLPFLAISSLFCEETHQRLSFLSGHRQRRINR